MMRVMAFLFSVLGFLSLCLSPEVHARTAASDACFTCHSDHFSAQHSHYPATQGLCDLCHTVQPEHTQAGDKQFVKTNRSSSVCINCHGPKDTAPKVHPALQMGEDSCLGCHNPHGSANASLFKDTIANTCNGCHKVAMTNRSVHGPMMGKLTCVECHHGHGGKKAKLMDTEGNETCFRCHDKVINSVIPGRVIPNIKEKVTQMSHIHAAAQENCTFCHQPHSSGFPHLLNANFPEKHYAKYEDGEGNANTYALCFNCHSKGLMNIKITADDTNFRNGLVNLHWRHVTNASSSSGPRFGRACDFCHEPHGATQAKLLKESFGPMNVPMVYSKTPNGGTCTVSCHGPRSYTR